MQARTDYSKNKKSTATGLCKGDGKFLDTGYSEFSDSSGENEMLFYTSAVSPREFVGGLQDRN